ncbi:hypothetical protein BY996DRAFT_3076941 [Phakopsora pachyrhizi]|nr:hypothetical protein BY996DRAFT_3076941 [Phakopsora pachyrhizi]
MSHLDSTHEALTAISFDKELFDLSLVNKKSLSDEKTASHSHDGFYNNKWDKNQLSSHQSRSSESLTSTTNSNSENKGDRVHKEKKLVRLDRDSELWRSPHCSSIYWRGNKLTFKEISSSLWAWSQNGIENARRKSFSQFHPPHSGHRAGMLDIFSPHRQKLANENVRRIYNDLYQILNTWNEMGILVNSSKKEELYTTEGKKQLRRIQNLLDFHIMIALREYGGLPLNPNKPDQASWPPPKKSKQSQSDTSNKKAEIISSPKSTPSVEIKNKSIIEHNLKTKETPEKQQICRHCHQVLKPNLIDQVPKNSDYETAQKTAREKVLDYLSGCESITRQSILSDNVGYEDNHSDDDDYDISTLNKSTSITWDRNSRISANSKVSSSSSENKNLRKSKSLAVLNKKKKVKKSKSNRSFRANELKEGEEFITEEEEERKGKELPLSKDKKVQVDPDITENKMLSAKGMEKIKSISFKTLPKLRIKKSTNLKKTENETKEGKKTQKNESPFEPTVDPYWILAKKR